MCNCIENVTNKFKEMYPQAENIYYQNVEIMSHKTYSTIEVKMPNKKKPTERLLLHSHCPICGKKYEEEQK